jgi:ABC-type uncharacterized transport system permease subunit
MKNICYLENKKGFLSILGLLFSLAIICFVMYLMMKTYFGKTAVSAGSETESAPVAGVQTYRSAINKTNKALDETEKKRASELKEALE